MAELFERSPVPMSNSSATRLGETSKSSESWSTHDLNDPIKGAAHGRQVLSCRYPGADYRGSRSNRAPDLVTGMVTWRRTQPESNR